MKKLLLTLIALLILISSKAQTHDYTVNWADTTTYKINCGKIVPGQWGVKNDSCTMRTPYLRVEVPEPVTISFNFGVNQSGNGDPTDKVYLWHCIDNNGIWILDSIFVAGGSPAVYQFGDSVTLEYGHFVQFRVSMQTNAKTEFWAIQDGKIFMDDGSPLHKIRAFSTPPYTPMPIELLLFTAKVVDQTVVLRWITSSETNNKYFNIEKTTDGKTYAVLVEIPGAGNSNQQLVYDFVDNYPSNGPSLYRLKQTDYDGKFAYSDHVFVNITGADLSYSIYPNPATSNNAELNIVEAKKGLTEIRIFDIAGKEVYEETHCGETNCVLKLNLDGFENGTYILSIKNGEHEFKSKLIKKD